MTREAAPGWKRLWWHSYALGARWVLREARHGWPAGKVGLTRLLVPLDPWRYYELGRVADQDFGGSCLDVSSPKLLPSLLHAEGKGRWTCVDLHAPEIEAWRAIDPELELDVQDATSLPYADESYDHAICVSVLEHVGGGGDSRVLGELWRVLKQGGTLDLTTDVAAEPHDVFTEQAAYGEASPPAEQRGVFFKHDYGVEEVDALLAERPWEVVVREYAAQRRPAVERRFYRLAPWSYAAGPFLRFVCPGNVVASEDPGLIERHGAGVVYVRLRKP